MTEEAPAPLHHLVPVIVDRLPAVLDEVARQLADQHPGYAAFVTAEFPQVLTGAQAFVQRLFTVATNDQHTPRFVSDAERALFATIGREHLHQRQDIDGLLAAYRIGAAVVWRHIADAALHDGLAASRFAGLATAVFAAVEELSSASLQGYLDEEAARRHTTERHRQELVELLLSPYPSAAAIKAVALRADWPVPGQAAVVLLEDDDDRPAYSCPLDDTCLTSRDRTVVVVPHPTAPGNRAHLRRILHGRGAVIGTTTTVDQLRGSLDLARLATRLKHNGLLTDTPLFVDDHLDTLIVYRDEQLLETLRAQLLAPVRALPGATADRLVETLTSWLLHMGNGRAVAADLQVHPQTVRYRLGRLRELLDLDAPRRRAALFLGLAWSGPGPDDERADPRSGRTPGTEGPTPGGPSSEEPQQNA